YSKRLVLYHVAVYLLVLATVDKYAEIEYSMVTPPSISNFLIELTLLVLMYLQGEFYNIGQHQEPPFSVPPFSLPPQTSSMLYIGLSSFMANSAGFVYNRAGALSLYITDDMVPSSSPIRLNTKTFGAFIPEVSPSLPVASMNLLITNDATGTLTAYAILPNTTLEPLFILNMVEYLQQGFPLPAIGRMNLINSKLQVQKVRLVASLYSFIT
uniref:Bactericidal permeability-increasing protein n=1 Tax=Paramormyrops kingsleyae TaxID=1676925 RepID=A0A3B3SZV0_9TELE